MVTSYDLAISSLLPNGGHLVSAILDFWISQNFRKASKLSKTESKGTFFWDYSGIGILGIDGICVLLGAIFGMNGISFRSFYSR